MPLPKGGGKKQASENVRELYHANEKKPAGKKRSRDQIIAIGLRAAGVPPKTKKSKK